MKCSTKRGWAVSHCWIAGVLWVEALSSTTCTSSSAGTSAVERLQELLELDRAVAASAASRSPCRWRCPARRTGSRCRGACSHGSRARGCPGSIGRIGGVRSSAWIWVFSSTQTPPRARAGPDTARRRRGPWRRTADPRRASTSPAGAAGARTPARSGAPPTASARPRAPSTASTSASRPSASLSSVLTITSSTCASVIVRGRPGRGSSTSPSSRSRRKPVAPLRDRVATLTPSRWRPRCSAGPQRRQHDPRTQRQRLRGRCRRDHDSNCSRSPSVSSIALRRRRHTNHIPTYRRINASRH